MGSFLDIRGLHEHDSGLFPICSRNSFLQFAQRHLPPVLRTGIRIEQVYRMVFRIVILDQRVVDVYIFRIPGLVQRVLDPEIRSPFQIRHDPFFQVGEIL